MSKNRYYYFDHETCAFVEVKTKPTKVFVQGGIVLAAAILLASIIVWSIDEWSDTPQELALKAENEALQYQLNTVGQRMQVLSSQLEHLSTADEELYRTLFQAEPISEDVRQVGVGGIDPYEQYSRFGTNASALLRGTAQMLDQLERQINLQNVSYRELTQLAEDRSVQLAQMPAILPADGPVVSGYGIRMHPTLKVRKMHHGIDILVRTGSPVFAAGDGIVRKARYSSTFGQYIEIEHSSAQYSTCYGHLSQIPRHIRPGTKVKRGEQIGLSGNTGRSDGPHLHYEVRDLEGRSLNPVYFFAPSMTPAQYKKLLAESERSQISLD